MKIHLIAIGGTGMGAVAGLLREAGHEVRGSDGPLYPPMSTMLAELSIPVAEGYAAKNLDWGPELVVLGNTCRSDHVEHLAAKERGLRVVSFPQLVREQLLPERQSLVVAGTHGKTTTTSLWAHVLVEQGLAPGYLIGGVPQGFGRSFALGKPPYFVLEGDEYDCACFDKRPKFVHYAPQLAILTGVEFDHADIYADIAAVERAFAQLVQSIPATGQLLVCAHSEAALRLARQARCEVQSYGAWSIDETPTVDADWVGRFERLEGGRQRLTLGRLGQSPLLCAAEVPLTGAHNMQNTVAVAVACASLQLPSASIASGLARFAGVRRRQELRGVVQGVAVIDDFAHHPTAVAHTLRGLRGVHGTGRLIAVFEPRSSTSRRNVFQAAYADALAAADVAFIAPLFSPDRIAPPERLDRKALVGALGQQGVEAHAPDSVDAILIALVDQLREGDTVVTMSSGGFEGLATRLLAALHKA